jgi:hypothetical protein
MILALGLGAAATVGFVGTHAADANPAPLGGFQCVNGISVICTGNIVVPIDVDIKNVGILDDNQLSVLSDDLNKLSVLDGGVLNHDKILNDVEVTVLQDFLNKFDIDVTKNDVDVCATVLGALICK